VLTYFGAHQRKFERISRVCHLVEKQKLTASQKCPCPSFEVLPATNRTTLSANATVETTKAASADHLNFIFQQRNSATAKKKPVDVLTTIPKILSSLR
jgi:hypothetical protein